jgi:hypothetical protein
MAHFYQPQSRLAPKFLAAAPRRSRHRRNKDKFRHGTKRQLRSQASARGALLDIGTSYLLDSETVIAAFTSRVSRLHEEVPKAFVGGYVQGLVGRTRCQHWLRTQASVAEQSTSHASQWSNPSRQCRRKRYYGEYPPAKELPCLTILGIDIRQFSARMVKASNCRLP